MRLRVLPLALGFAAWTTACGYHFTGTASTLPPGIHSLSIGEIGNETHQPGLEKNLAFALEREVLRQGRLRLEEKPGAGDAVITGKIRRFDVRPVAFNARDEALQYEIALEADLQLRQNTDGRILWAVEGLRGSDEYSAVARVVVTSSSQFQRGRLDPADLAQFTDIQLAESEQRQAIGRLLDTLARDAYALMLEGF